MRRLEDMKRVDIKLDRRIADSLSGLVESRECSSKVRGQVREFIQRFNESPKNALDTINKRISNMRNNQDEFEKRITVGLPIVDLLEMEKILEYMRSQGIHLSRIKLLKIVLMDWKKTLNPM